MLHFGRSHDPRVDRSRAFFRNAYHILVKPRRYDEIRAILDRGFSLLSAELSTPFRRR